MKIQNIHDAVIATHILKDFISQSQLSVTESSFLGEEKEFFFDKVIELAHLISNMPKTYEQDGKGDQAVAYLHYFNGSMDFYITERDSDPEGEGQVQAFGLADLGYGAELGYISIQELITNNIELDLYFTPKTLADIKAGK